MKTETPIEIARRVWPGVSWWPTSLWEEAGAMAMLSGGMTVGFSGGLCTFRDAKGMPAPGFPQRPVSIEDGKRAYQRHALAVLKASGLPSHEDAFREAPMYLSCSREYVAEDWAKHRHRQGHRRGTGDQMTTITDHNDWIAIGDHMIPRCDVRALCAHRRQDRHPTQGRRKG